LSPKNRKNNDIDINYGYSVRKNHNNIGIEEKRHFFRGKWTKIAENSYHNTDPEIIATI
jgi:hypothetical protein